MTRPPPHDLYVSERPVRSDYALERSYARRRVTTLLVLGVIIGAVIYGFCHHGASSPADIPTVKAEASYKQKPADPGGIDIPHQDVRVYDELEGKNTPAAQVEHLLPPPEVPQDVPHPPATAPAPVAAVAPAAGPAKADIVLSDPAPAPVVMPAPAPAAAPVAVVKKTAPLAPVKQQPVATDAPESLTIEQVIKETASPAAVADPAAPAPAVAAPASGKMAAVQLASVPDEAKAKNMMSNLQDKFSSQLGDAQLRLVSVSLGSRGVFTAFKAKA